MRSIDLLVIVLAMGILGIILASIIVGVEQKNTEYELPNGVICEDISIYRYSYTFSNCDDGKTYLNPDSWKKIKTKKEVKK